MMKTLGTIVVGLGTALLLAGCCGGDKEKDTSSDKKDEKACPAKFAELGSPAGDVSCTCPAGAAKGSVWGTDIYTTDSSPCGAAIHAGAITTAGGTVTMRAAKGCGAYTGTARNGVTSDAWASWGSSFYFPSKGNGTCPAGGAAATPPPAASAASGTTCPSTFKDVPGLNATSSITCTCDATRMTGSLWGSDNVYTQDSSICKAAVHSGAIPSSGGSVTAKATQGCKSYKGSTKNGVTAAAWGPYQASFFFPSQGDGACAK